MKFELTIKTTYMPEWGIWEGLRELAQNGRDAEVEFDAPLTVRHRKESMTLVIENDGCVLPYEALLLGHTSKTSRPDLIGKFGEGLKLGILALVRAGCEIKIRSGSEVWVPSIQRSEKFKADVLTFDIQKGREPKNRVAIEVANVSEEAWQALQDKLLFLRGSIKDDEMVDHERRLAARGAVPRQGLREGDLRRDGHAPLLRLRLRGRGHRPGPPDAVEVRPQLPHPDGVA